MKKLHLSYLPALFFRVVEKRSFVPRLAASFAPTPAARSASKNLHISKRSLRRFNVSALLFVTRPFLRAY